MQFLVDTDWVIDYLHNVGRVVRYLESLPPGALGLSVISLAELYEGISNPSSGNDGEQDLDEPSGDCAGQGILSPIWTF